MMKDPNGAADFAAYLHRSEKAESTKAKYTAEVRTFLLWCGERALPLSKETVLAYKAALCSTRAPSGINAALSALNAYLAFCGRGDCRAKAVKVQKKMFLPREKLLTRAEYARLLAAAAKRKNPRLLLLLQTLCGLGLRVSELPCITVDAARKGCAVISCKGKTRTLPLPKPLCEMLLQYAAGRGISGGAVFVTRSGKPMDRSNIWQMMKDLCKKAGVPPEKVYPHNLRHLFARTFYAKEKDAVRLADLLGHSSIDTTRIYTMESGESQRRAISALGLIQSEEE